MQNILKLILATLPVFMAGSVMAQAQHIRKLEVPKKQVYIVAASHLQIDTLILHDKATLQFAPEQQHTLKVKYSYIGDKCTITATGENGKHGRLGVSGEGGSSGGSIALDMHFMKLGSLTIDTRGGNGGDGYIGKHGKAPRIEVNTIRVADGKGGYTIVEKEHLVDGTSGEHGTAPGAGGNGGDLILSYSSNGFIPILNRDDAPHSVTVLYQAGEDGKQGQDGVSFTTGNGHIGNSYQAFGEPKDGKINISKNLGQLALPL